MSAKMNLSTNIRVKVEMNQEMLFEQEQKRWEKLIFRRCGLSRAVWGKH